MTDSSLLSSFKKLIRYVLFSLSGLVIVCALSLLFRLPAFSYAALLLALISSALLYAALRQIGKAETAIFECEKQNKSDCSRYERIAHDLIPVLSLLSREDAAVVAASGTSRPPIAFAETASDPLDRLESFLKDFREPEDDSIDRTGSLGAVFSSTASIREMELRIPFIDEILKRVVDHTEQAAMTLIERFSLISEQTERSDKDAKSALEALGSGADGAGLDSLISKSHSSIVGRNAVINDFLKLNRENAGRVKKMSELVTRSEELISGIEDITERSKLIAFNMAVESAKIGEKGRGFKVIVNELQRLNDQTTAFARDIMEIVKSFRTYNEQLLDQWLVKSEALTEQVRSDSDQAELAVTALKQSYELSGSLFHSLTDSAISVNKAMSDILESLQFQDITRQQIEGAVSFLVEIRSSVDQLRALYESIGCGSVDRALVLRGIREKHEKQLKVSKDHDLFEIIERRYR